MFKLISLFSLWIRFFYPPCLRISIFFYVPVNYTSHHLKNSHQIKSSTHIHIRTFPLLVCYTIFFLIWFNYFLTFPNFYYSISMGCLKTLNCYFNHQTYKNMLLPGCYCWGRKSFPSNKWDCSCVRDLNWDSTMGLKHGLKAIGETFEKFALFYALGLG